MNKDHPKVTPASDGEEARNPRYTYLEHFRFRVLQDALTEATAMYWKRRAEALERALPRREDFHGAATREQLLERYDALQRDILACRRHANLLASRTIAPAGADDDVRRVLAEATS